MITVYTAYDDEGPTFLVGDFFVWLACTGLVCGDPRRPVMRWIVLGPDCKTTTHKTLDAALIVAATR